MLIDRFKRLILITLAITSLTLFSNCLSEKSSVVQAQITAENQKYFAPEIPEQVFFFGEKVDLTNYYLRERYDRELLSFSYWHSQIFLIIKRANKFFPIIEPILKAEGVPDDFKYLALVESNLDQRTVSPAKAAGIWQILPETGKEYGLEVAEDVDERYNVEKSTIVACQYLKRTYELTGNWATAAASYNTGRARVLRQIEEQQTDDYFSLLFSEETNRYVFRMIMAKQIMNNPQKYGFHLKREDLYYFVDHHIVEVDSTISNLTNFAKQYGITYQLLKDLNPWLRTNKLNNKNGKAYFIKIPKKNALSVNPQHIYVHDKNWIID